MYVGGSRVAQLAIPAPRPAVRRLAQGTSPLDLRHQACPASSFGGSIRLRDARESDMQQLVKSGGSIQDGGAGSASSDFLLGWR